MGTKNKKQTGFRLFAITLIVAALIVAAGMHYEPASAQNPGLKSTKSETPLPASAPAPARPVSYTVSSGQIIREVVLTGELRAARSTAINAPDIRSSFSNTVTFLAPEGKIVKQGERIVEFDDSSLLSSKSEAERTLDEAKLSILKKKADLEAERCDLLNSVAQAEASLDAAELYGKISKDLLPANTYQKYQLDLDKAKIALQKAKEQLDNFEKSYASQIQLVEINRSQAEINLKKIESDMSLLKIDAPQDGILIYGDNWTSNRKIQPGDNVFHEMEVASLPDLSTMQVIGYVYDTEYGSILRDARCSVTLDALPGFTVDGRVVSLTSVASRKGFASTKKLFQTVIHLDKVDTASMKPGMTARIRIPMVLAKETLAVPRDYLGTDAQGRYFVLKGTEPKAASTQIVELGAIGDRLVQIVTGVSPGDPLLPVQRLGEVSK
jgi:multidrug efflux pump subunit AcrA (membrane-fusion protein)